MLIEGGRSQDGQKEVGDESSRVFPLTHTHTLANTLHPHLAAGLLPSAED